MSDMRLLIELVDGPLPMERIRRFVHQDVEYGGIVTFEGITRREVDAEHGTLRLLDYEAYAEMALAKMNELAVAAVERWKLGRVAMVHRIGRVPPGDASVCIMTSAWHRAESFEACQWLIDLLKADVPIWKKDVFEDGFTRWVEPRT